MILWPGAGEFLEDAEVHRTAVRLATQQYLQARAELLSVLAAGGFDGTISLEWERHWHPELAPIGEALYGFEKVFGAFSKSRRQTT